MSSLNDISAIVLDETTEDGEIIEISGADDDSVILCDDNNNNHDKNNQNASFFDILKRTFDKRNRLSHNGSLSLDETFGVHLDVKDLRTDEAPVTADPATATTTLPPAAPQQTQVSSRPAAATKKLKNVREMRQLLNDSFNTYDKKLAELDASFTGEDPPESSFLRDIGRELQRQAVSKKSPPQDVAPSVTQAVPNAKVEKSGSKAVFQIAPPQEPPKQTAQDKPNLAGKQYGAVVSPAAPSAKIVESAGKVKGNQVGSQSSEAAMGQSAGKPAEKNLAGPGVNMTSALINRALEGVSHQRSQVPSTKTADSARSVAGNQVRNKSSVSGLAGQAASKPAEKNLAGPGVNMTSALINRALEGVSHQRSVTAPKTGSIASFARAPPSASTPKRVDRVYT